MRRPVSKALPISSVSVESIRGAIEAWAGEEGVNPSQAHQVLKNIEVRPTQGLPSEVDGIPIIQSADACNLTAHIHVI